MPDLSPATSRMAFPLRSKAEGDPPHAVGGVKAKLFHVGVARTHSECPPVDGPETVRMSQEALLEQVAHPALRVGRASNSESKAGSNPTSQFMI